MLMLDERDKIGTALTVTHKIIMRELDVSADEAYSAVRGMSINSILIFLAVRGFRWNSFANQWQH